MPKLYGNRPISGENMSAAEYRSLAAWWAGGSEDWRPEPKSGLWLLRDMQKSGRRNMAERLSCNLETLQRASSRWYAPPPLVLALASQLWTAPPDYLADRLAAQRMELADERKRLATE